METPEKEYAEGGLKSHRVMGLQEDLTPASTPPPTKGASEAVSRPEGAQEGGGVTGFIKSLVAGTPLDASEQPEGTVTHEGNLKDGSTAAVKTGVSDTTVPASLKESSPQPAGVARTQITEPVSPYAPALELIAGPPEAADPSKKFGPALDPIAGAAATDSAGGITGAATTIVGTVSAAAGAAVDTLKQAAGYGTPEEQAAAGGPTGLSAKPGVVTVPDLPKAGVVESHGDGTAEIKPAAEGWKEGVAATELKPAGTGSVSQPVEAKEKSPGSRPNVKPPVSAFAAEPAPAEEPKKAAEASTTAAAPVQAVETKPAGESKTEGEKVKAPVCGCCVVS